MTVYIVLAAWSITRNNHAGMYYLAKKIAQNSGIDIRIFKLPVWKLGYLYPIYRIYAIILGLYLRVICKKNDIVWLMEYLLKRTEQSDIAKIVRNHAKVIGLAHLVPEMILKDYTDGDIKKKIELLDEVYVFGNSLKEFFISKGVSGSKIHVTYHYVDIDYYTPISNRIENNRLKVICMGNMQRNYQQLYNIVDKCRMADFIICIGKNKKLFNLFSKLKNVSLVGYVSEDELKSLMQQSNISLSVMNDTIGSNVIVSSLACGLPVIASNVGSIADYIDDGVNGYLFKTTEEAVKYISTLSDSSELIILREKARLKAEQISLSNFIRYFRNEICKV
jgi:glycosyltransferase involved in cell wall biosynthesis